MKTFKAICGATVLALSLSVPAYAEDTNPGDGHTPGRPVPTSVGIATGPDGSGSISDLPPVDGDLGLLTLANILWALASIY